MSKLDQNAPDREAVLADLGACVEYDIQGKRRDFQEIHGRITSYILEYLAKHKAAPSDYSIAHELSLNRKTVAAHRKYLRFDLQLPELKELTPIILRGFALRTAVSGKAADVKFWMQLVEGWAETVQVNHGGEIVVELPEELKELWDATGQDSD